MKLPEPKEVMENLTADVLYQDWQTNNKEVFLTHFFCPLSSEMKVKQNWDVGFYNTVSKKMTVFSTIEKGFAIKPEDDVFKKDDDIIEKLDLDQVKLTIDEASKKYQEVVNEKYADEMLGDGFLILQKIKDRNLWNFTFITKSLKFLNVKIDSSSGEVASSDLVSVVSQE